MQVDDKVDVVCVCDDSGVIQIANKLLHQMFGYKRDELVGKPVSVLIPSPFAAAHAGYIKRYVASGTVRCPERTSVSRLVDSSV